jgi:hypothetical protein
MVRWHSHLIGSHLVDVGVSATDTLIKQMCDSLSNEALLDQAYHSKRLKGGYDWYLHIYKTMVRTYLWGGRHRRRLSEWAPSWYRIAWATDRSTYIREEDKLINIQRCTKALSYFLRAFSMKRYWGQQWRIEEFNTQNYPLGVYICVSRALTELDSHDNVWRAGYYGSPGH